MTPWTVAHQAPLSMEFSRQEYWSGLPCPLPQNLPDLRMEPMSPAWAGEFFTIELSGKPTDLVAIEINSLVSKTFTDDGGFDADKK